ncbi:MULTISPECIES: hypothetical protein [Brevibacterium]|uniref:Minor tail protein n=1 Tax=Brevibacterium antiquum CNRZ 918 TaxID=1255637 RepID=A0A2H1KEL8_9MICO|nr:MULTISPECIES: hypothetical protein [Brevibacterium]SMX98203.1 hypothetical protein BANT918_02401 [Brevibacterium antiquum CNRZ 918]HCG55321.1 hypothetical protein [Brevibacterium sp.]
MKQGWRHHVVRANGDGTITPVQWDVPISGAGPLTDLSGPGAFEGTITPEVMRLKDEGGPLIVPWSTVVLSERDEQLKAVSLITDVNENGPDLGLSGVGYGGYAAQPYTGETFEGVKVDPLDQVRRMWNHLQGLKGGGSDLGVVIDDTTSPVRIGEEPRDVSFSTGDGQDVEFEAGPYVLARWKTDDMAKEIDSLAEQTPFDYRMEHKWKPNRDDGIESFLRIGYPKIGVRRNRLRFVVGENVIVRPQIQWDGDDYASDVLFLGAGEGREQRWARVAHVTGDRLRRCVVVSDKSVTSGKAAEKSAWAELDLRLGIEDITEITVTDHHNARFNTWGLGDEILITTPAGWAQKMRLWVRVLAEKWDCDKDELTLTVKRVEKVS